MPTHTGKDSKGCYAQWGGKGKKYYYTCGNASARKRAISKADAQGRAAHAHGYVGNAGGTMPEFQYVTTNVKSIVRQDSMEGKDWVVVPTQMITEGVHNGSEGPIYYPADELSKIPAVWNHKPVVVYHPTRNGQSVSACDPIELTTRKVGIMLNTQWDGETKKLGTETWLDPDRMAAVDARIGEAIENNEMMEVSTGLFMNLERTKGEWNGEEYVGIARNLQPDHLALLPDVKGACSIDDGAGFLRLNQEYRTLVANEMGHDSVRRLLSSAIQDKNNGDAWIEEVYDSFFIYESGGTLYRQTYTNDNETINISGIPEQVVRVTEYRSLTGEFIGNDTKGNDMNKKKIIDALIGNERTNWTEDDRESLMAMDDKVLSEMTEYLKEPAPIKNQKPEKKEPPKTEPVVNQEPEKKETAPPKPVTAQEYISNAPPEIREMLETSIATLNAEKANLIEEISANERNTFTKEHLESMKIDMLRALATLAKQPKEEETHPFPLYNGQGDVATNKDVKIEPLKLPTMNFDQKTA